MSVEILPALIVPQLSDLFFIHGTQAPKQSKIISESHVVLVISQRAGDMKSSKNASCPLPCQVLFTMFEMWHSLAPGIPGPFRVPLSSQQHARIQRPHAGLSPNPLNPEERLWKIRVETSFLQPRIWNDTVSSQLQSFSQVP